MARSSGSDLERHSDRCVPMGARVGLRSEGASREGVIRPYPWCELWVEMVNSEKREIAPFPSSLWIFVN
jgi:hypothetical protein